VVIRLPVEVAQGILNITPSMRGLQALIDREMRGVDSRRAGQQAGEGYSSGFGASAKKLTGVLAGAFAAVKVGDFAKDAVAQASDLAEVGTKMQTVFGDANTEVQKFASQGAKALGLSSLEAQNAAANFGVFGKSAGLAGKDQADFSTGMAKLAVDMASFSNTTPEDAIEALSSGLRGEAEPLRKYGVLLDDASLRQEALSMGLIATTKDALTPQQKVLASHALILKQTSDAQGDFERTSGGLANQQRILSAQWTDMKGKLGAAFLPAVTATVTALNDHLFPALEGIGTKASTAFAEVRPQLEAAWNVLRTGDFPGASAGIGEEDSPLVAGLLKANDLFGRVGPTLKEAWSILAGGDFKGGLGFEEDSPFVDFMFKLRDVGLDVFGKVKDIWDQLWDLGEKLWPSIESIGKSFYEAWQTINDGGWSTFDLVFDAIKVAVDGLITVLNATLVPALDWLARFFRENPQEVYLLVGAFTAWKVAMLAQSTATWLVQAATKAWAVAQGILNAVMDANPITLVIVAIAALAAGIIWAYNNVDWFREAVDTAWQFIKDATNSLWEGVIKPAFNWLAENIHVVGDFFVSMWNAAQPVFDFLKNSWDNFLTIIQGVIDVVVGVFTGDWSRAWDGVKAIFTGIWDQIVNYVETAWELISGAFTWAWEHTVEPVLGWINDALTTTGQFFSDLFHNTVDPVWGWIQDKINTVWLWLRDNVFTPLNAAVSLVGQFFTGLWDTVQTIWGNISGFFVNIAKGIDDAVTKVKTGITDIKKEIDGFFERFTNWGGTTSGGVLGNIDLGAPRAAGGVIPGTDPGRRDNVLTPMRSGESVFVPEFTKAIGGEATVYAWNRLAEQGRLGDIGLGLARGGVIGGQQAGDLIANQSLALVGYSRDKIKEAFDSGPGVGALSNGNWGPGVKGAFAANTAAAKAYIEGHFTGVSSIGGLYGGSVPGSDHPMGKALDVMIANYLSSQGIAAGTKIADWFIQNPNSFGTKYVIWRDRINQGGQWSPYSHPSGNNDTLQHRDHVHISFLTGLGQFAAGAQPPAVGDDTQSALGKILTKVRGQAGIAGLPGGGPAPVSGGVFPPNVERWRATVLQGLGLIGQPASLANTVLNQIRTESSGNPNAINLTDINAQRGYPSRGLVQTIPQTFAAYRLPSLSNNIVDPLANIVSGMRYAIARYGSIPAGMRGVAYDNGGWLQPGGVPMNFLNKPEAVLTPPQSSALLTHAKALEAGFQGQTAPVQIILDSSDPLQVAVGRMMKQQINGTMVDLLDAADLAGMQSL
jgi:hypothetical protein